MSDLEKQLNKSSSVLVQKADNRQKRTQRVLFDNASIIMIYGLQIVIPVLLGIALGRYFDNQFPHPFLSWKLNCIIVGFIVGICDANFWLKKSFCIKGKKHGAKY